MPLTVAQLIEKLKQFSPDLRVEYWDHDSWDTNYLDEQIAEKNGAVILNPPEELLRK